MDTDYGLVPLPDGGTEAYDAYMDTEERGVTVCKGDPSDPLDGVMRCGCERWCPGHCARFASPALWAP